MKRRIILASGSPRRADILREHGIAFEVRAADVDEHLENGTDPASACMYLALKKALAVRETENAGLIIAADTVVVHGGRILGKPADEKDAFDTLKRLKNDVHSVMTGVAICDAESENTSVFCEKTRVFFSDYTEEDIRGYIATGEPADKAGSYAIQGGWSKFVKKIEGDYSNVVGLPWKRLAEELDKFGG